MNRRSERSKSASTPPAPTVELLRLAKQGDAIAREKLLARYTPRLRRWAAGRLPMRARSLFDTSDLVQDTLAKVLQGLDRIEVRGPGGFQAYVRQAISNRIRDEVRWASRRGSTDVLPEDIVDSSPSPLENAIGRDVLDRYERALARLDDREQELVHLRLELDFEYGEIAAMMGRPSADAVRMAFGRALARLAQEMNDDR